MRLLIALVVIIYIVGVGVVLAPTIRPSGVELQRQTLLQASLRRCPMQLRGRCGPFKVSPIVVDRVWRTGGR